MLVERDICVQAAGKKAKRLYSLNTYFFTLLTKDRFQGPIEYADVKRWNQEINIFKEVDRMFIPICKHGNHWVLVEVNMDGRRIAYYDSLNGSGQEICEAIQEYLLLAEADLAGINCQRPESGGNLRLPPWQVESQSPRWLPKQTNSTDCGVFLCFYAYHLSMGEVTSK